MYKYMPLKKKLQVGLRVSNCINKKDRLLQRPNLGSLGMLSRFCPPTNDFGDRCASTTPRT